MAFWSTIYTPGAKSTRLKKYLDFFDAQGNINVTYYGFPEKKEILTNKHSSIASYVGPKTCNLAARICARVAKKLAEIALVGGSELTAFHKK